MSSRFIDHNSANKNQPSKFLFNHLLHLIHRRLKKNSQFEKLISQSLGGEEGVLKYTMLLELKHRFKIM